MGIHEFVLIGIGLAMDAFAVSICKGLSMPKMNWKKALIITIYFSLFQMVMPAIGFLLGVGFSDIVEVIDHWIAFALLSFIGIKMIREAIKGEDENLNDNVNFKNMMILSIATSIDALTVGITFAFLETRNIALAIGIIGIITFTLCLTGVKIGNKFGNKCSGKAEILGGSILIFIGIKILLEHLQIL